MDRNHGNRHGQRDGTGGAGMSALIARYAKKKQLAATGGSALVGHQSSAVGSIASTVKSKIDSTVDAVIDFGADRTGANNSTSNLLAFFNHCILTGEPGHIKAGSYLVNAGVLSFDNNFTNKAWPNITTDGYDNVYFLRADATDAPLLSISNGVATSSVGKYWNGGSLGGITFEQNGKATGPEQHGLSLRGVWGTKFGWMRGNDLGGSSVHIPEALFNTANPDPYAVTFCEFDGIEGIDCSRFTLENRNWLGFNGCTIKNLRVVRCQLGGWHGFGAANSLGKYSMGDVSGWAFDDGTNAAATGGAPLRIDLGMGELDNVENVMRINRLLQMVGKSMRIVHRFNTGQNVSALYWPRKVIDVAGGVGANVGNIDIEITHRIEAGGTKAGLGVFYDGSNNANVRGVSVDQRVQDNGGIGITDADIFTGVSLSSSTVITKNGGIPINDRRFKVAALVRANTSDVVPNSGYLTAASKISFGVKMYDFGGYYDSAKSEFTVPWTGLYRVSGRICISVPVGTRVRVAFAVNESGVITVLHQKYYFASNESAIHYDVDGVVLLTQGQKLFLMADQNTAGPVNLSAPSSATADITWGVEAL
jgi:hypothetical protein